MASSKYMKLEHNFSDAVAKGIFWEHYLDVQI